MDHEARIGRVTASLRGAGVDGLLVTDLTNVRYLTGFAGSNGMVLVTGSETVFFSDTRYAARAQDMVQGASIEIYQDRPADGLTGHLAGIGRLGIEADTMTVSSKGRLDQRLEDVELVATTGLVEALRRVKEPEELELIRAACEITDATFAHVLGGLAVGCSEKDIALEIEVHMREAGAEAASFEPIVGSGPLSAHIHHTPSGRVLQKGDLVLLDLGSRCEGYCSDLTRTVVLGPATDEQRAVYDLVLAAQVAAVDALRPGMPASDADGAARGLIDAAGEGEAFPHGLGHGVGLDVHEAPRLARTSEDSLQAGEVVTIEPGVYHAGDGGVRVEDCVLVTSDGAEVLTRAPRNELFEL